MEDTFRHKGMRNQLVNQIAHKGIVDEPVLNAFREVPRHFFFDSAFTEHAYEDKPFPIGSGQTISQPFTVAFQTQLLEVQPGDKILEIGTGSGYQAAILAAMRARVYTMERHRDLYKRSQQIIERMGYKRIQFFLGDGFEGKPAYCPYDKIIITCGAPYMPESLLKQLKVGGCIVAPIGKGHIQEMQRWTQKEDGEFEKSSYGNFSFVPMLRGHE